MFARIQQKREEKGNAPGRVSSRGWAESQKLLSPQPMTSSARTDAPKYS